MRKLSLPAPAPFAGRTSHFAIFESMSEFADTLNADAKFLAEEEGRRAWAGNMTKAEALRATVAGNLPGVAALEQFLERMEAFELPTARHQTIDDVCGGVPNVPAFIAGHPLNMRRRVRRENEAAPIAVIVDTISGADIEADKVNRRGAAILALVRALSARRPVELWACGALDADNTKNAVFVLIRIETTPLDLATAAFALAHAAFPRQLIHRYGFAHYGFQGRRPFGGIGPLETAQFRAAVLPALPHVTDAVCVPGMGANDLSLTDPAAWLARQIAEHGAVNLDEAA
jgi:hypothetical protein